MFPFIFFHLAVMSSLHHHALLVVTWLHPVTAALLHSVDVHDHLLLHAHVVLLHAHVVLLHLIT